jgi:hypothetical protein
MVLGNLVSQYAGENTLMTTKRNPQANSISSAPVTPLPEPISAPWNNLKGWGYISTYKPNKEWLMDCAGLSDWEKDHYAGGPAVTMLVRYTNAECGPYDELLCMMGRFRTNRGVFPRIHRIWVSTHESIAGGRYNWANAKQLGQFSINEIQNGLSASVESDSGRVDLVYKRPRFALKFPVTTALSTKKMRLIANDTLPEQQRPEPFCYSEPRAKGWCTLAKLESFRSENQMLPDLGSQKHLLSVKAAPFKLAFPKAEFGD